MTNPLILALDVEPNEAQSLIKEVSPHIDIIKIGSRLFTALGPKVVEWAHDKKMKVFLDLKYHDIPNTVADACRCAVQLKVWGLTIHTSGGIDMMEEASKAVLEESNKLRIQKPFLLGVTVLTSLSDLDLKDLGVEKEVLTQVEYLAQSAKRSHLDGVVASGNEIEAIRKSCGKDFLVVTPGIRLDGKDQEDQKRVMTPKRAMDLGANYLVIGRPILKAKDRVKTIKEILESIQ